MMVPRPELVSTTPRRQPECPVCAPGNPAARTASTCAAHREPTLEEWRARCLLAQSIISHRYTDSPDRSDVLAVLRGDLSLDGAE